MNTLNRIWVVVDVLVLLLVCVAVFVAPIPILSAASDALKGFADSLSAVRPVLRFAVGALLAVAWAVVCALFLILELFPRRRRTVRVERVDGGEAEVSLKTVHEHVVYALDKMPGVLRARPSVSARKGGVVIEVEVDIASDMDVPPQASKIVEVVRRIVEEKVGVKLSRPPKVRLRATAAPALAARRTLPRRADDARRVEPATRPPEKDRGAE